MKLRSSVIMVIFFVYSQNLYAKGLVDLCKRAFSTVFLSGSDRAGTALAQAVIENNISAVELSLRQGADPDTKIPDVTKFVLIEASRWGYTEIVESLIKAGANLHVEMMNRDTALIQAIEHGHIKIVERLLEAGAYLDTKGNTHLTILMGALRYGHRETVKVLLKAGYNVTAEGKTVFEWAEKNGPPEFATALSKID